MYLHTEYFLNEYNCLGKYSQFWLFSHTFSGFYFFSDETLRHGQMFQRIGESECQNNPLGFSGLWVTLKEFNPISYTEALKIMKQIHLITRESKPHLVWQINVSKNTWTPNYDCFRRKYHVFYSEMHNSLLCVHKKSSSLLAVAALSMIVR